MDSTSAADSACSRRSSSKRSPSCRCIWRSAWTSASMSGTPERGNRGGEPAAIARAAAAMAVSGWAIERPATSASTAPTRRASSAAPATACCARPDDRRPPAPGSAATRMTPGAAGHRDVHELAPDRFASPGGHAGAAGERTPDLGPAGVVLDRREGARREVAVGADPARAVHQRDAMVVLPGEPVNRLVPAERVGRQRLADQPRPRARGCRAMSPSRSRRKRALGAPEEDQHRENAG